MLSGELGSAQGLGNRVPLEGCACPRCGANRSRIVLRSPDRQFDFPDVFCVSRCAECGLLFQNPRIASSELSRHYPDEYPAYGEAEFVLAEETKWYLKNRMGYRHLESDLKPTSRQIRFGRAASASALIPEYAPRGRVVEIGCAAGNRLALFRRLGWESCAGIEYSEAAAAAARARGLEVTTGPIEEVVLEIPDRSLNAIIAGFVIEHVPNPFALAGQLAAKLKEGGQFLFSTVNVDTPDFWLYGRHWYNLDLPRHMVFFRKRDLHAMLDPDFEIEKIYYQSSPNDYFVSATYRLQDGARGWRKRLDSTLLGPGPKLSRLFSYLARAGLGARFFVIARKK